MNFCYVCGKTTTSKEHVPAKCFFPEDSAYRKQLITVPSCNEHNENTSKDDEYVRNVITIFYQNNPIAFQQFMNKVVKSLSRDKSLAGILHKIQTPQGIVPAIEIDRPRLDKVIRKMAYALYYNEFKKPWNRKLIVFSKHLVFKNLETDDFSKLIHFAENNLPNSSFDGKNPTVFKYNLFKLDTGDENSVIRIVFYEGFTFWITSIQNSNSFEL